MNALRQTARLELSFACRAGKTYLAGQFASYPLKVLRPFELGDGRVLVQLLNVGPGLLAGDTYELQVTLEPGANVVLVNQSATKLHRMPGGVGARQALTIEVAEGAALEYYPGLSIPFAGSDARFATTVRLEESARFALLELLAMGRVSRGEVFAFHRLSSRFKVSIQDRLVYADGLELTPERAGLTGISDGFSYLASGFWRWDTPWLSPDTAALPDLQLAVGLCGPEHGYLRALARDGLTLMPVLRALLQDWQTRRGVKPIPFARLML